MNKNSNLMVRNLDCVYFRVERDGCRVSLSFTDLTENEQKEQLHRLDEEGLRRMCLILAATLREMGDRHDIIRQNEK